MPANGVNYQLLQDVIVDTLRNLPHDEYELMWETPRYEGVHIFQEERRISEGGKGIQRHIILDPDGNAQFVPLFNTKVPNVSSSQRLLFVPWTFLTTNYSWDEREIIMNGPDEVGFINLIRVRRDQSMWGISKLLHNAVFSTPQNSADTVHMYGIPYYLPFLNNGITAAGFTANLIRYQDGSTGTVCAGLDANVDSKWNAYGGTYKTVNNELLRTIRTAIKATRFQGSPLVKTKDGHYSPSFQDARIYTNMLTSTALEDLADKRDDASKPGELLGTMLHSFEGIAYLNKMPIMYIIDLDSETVVNGVGATVNPNSIRCVNWDVLQAYVLSDYWMQEKKPMSQPAQPNLLTVNVDAGGQIICLNRRTVGWTLHNPL